MSDNQTTQPAGESAQTTSGTGPATTPASESWQEVGKQFQALGETLAAALRSTWYDEENRKRLQAMQSGLESMVQEVGSAIKETATGPEAHKAKEQVGKAAQMAAESARTAGVQAAQTARSATTQAAVTARAATAQALQEAKPHVVSALRQLNDELQKLITRMEQSKADAAAATAAAATMPTAPATPVEPAAPAEPPAPSTPAPSTPAPSTPASTEEPWYKQS